MSRRRGSAWPRALAWLALGGAAVPIVAALLAPLAPPLDSFGLFLPPAIALAAFVLSLAAVFLRAGAALVALVLLVAGGLAAVPILGTAPPPDGAAALRLVQHNLNARNPAPRLVERLADGTVDVATLQEIPRAAGPAFRALRRDGWTIRDCRVVRPTGTAVLSRLPATASGCLSGGAWMRVAAPFGEVTVVSIHLYWPWPERQAAQLAALGPELAALPGPLVIGGDFNQSPWSAAVAEIARASGTRVLPGLRLSFPIGPAALPIDHVLAPPGWGATATLGPQAGSDHRAVRATLSPPAAATDAATDQADAPS